MECILDFFPKLVHILDFVPLQEILGQLGGFKPFDILNVDLDIHLLPAIFLSEKRLGNLDARLFMLPRLGSEQQFIKLLDGDGSYKAVRSYLDFGIVQLLLFFDVLDLDHDISHNPVFQLDRGPFSPRRPDAGPFSHLLDLSVHLLIRYFQLGLGNRNAIEWWQIDFGADLDLEIKRQRAFLRKLDLLKINIGLAQGFQFFILDDRLTRVGQKLQFDLLGCLFAKSLLQ